MIFKIFHSSNLVLCNLLSINQLGQKQWRKQKAYQPAARASEGLVVKRNSRRCSAHGKRASTGTAAFWRGRCLQTAAAFLPFSTAPSFTPE